MEFSVALFAYQKERHGPFARVTAEPSVTAILAALGAKGINVGHCRLAVNERVANADEPVPPGAELALIPPVSGG